MTTESMSLNEEAVLAAQKREREKRRIRRLQIMLPFLLLLVAFVYTFSTNFIPSTSMLPTLRPGDHILTMRAWIAYPGGRMPARGDIVVFNLPKERLEEEGLPPEETDNRPAILGGSRQLGVFRRPPGDILIKRVVGLPGEEIRLVGDEVYINGQKMPRNYQITPSGEATTYFYGSYQPVKLGPEELFVMGDNRNNSEDSRIWGPIKRQDILGKFICVLWHEGESGPNRRRAEQEEQMLQEQVPIR